MSLFPDYIIGTDDIRFDNTWYDWSSKIASELDSNSLAPNYFNQLQFVVVTDPTELPSKQIPHDILKAVKFLESTINLDTYIIGYDSNYVPFDQLNQILITYMYSRRRHDWVVGATTAFALTEKLNQEILDYPIPRINLIAITYLIGLCSMVTN